MEGTEGCSRLTLVLGGMRSGKSRYAEDCALSSGLEPVYVATATAQDEEMAARIRAHRRRRDRRWRTLEVPLELPAAIRKEADSGRFLVVDCLTLWLANLLGAGRNCTRAFADLEGALCGSSGAVLLVSNEVGLGVVPADPLARRFIDLAGELHQRLARCSDRVVWIVAGLPLVVKPDRSS